MTSTVPAPTHAETLPLQVAMAAGVAPDPEHLTRGHIPQGVPVGSYARRSKDDSRKRRVSTTHQLERNGSWATAQGYNVVESYVDEGITAANDDVVRPEWERCLRDLASGRIRGVVVYHADRFYRTPIQVMRLGSLLPRVGGFVHPVDSDPLWFATAADMLQAIIQSGVNYYEVARMKERVTDTKAGRRAKGGWTGGPAPFGYRLVYPNGPANPTLEVVDSEADTIKRIAAWIVKGESNASIARRLNEAKVPGWRGQVGHWTQQGIRGLMRRPTIAGMTRDLTTGDLSWPAILTRDEWDAVQEVLTDPVRYNPKSGRRYLLTALVTNDAGQGGRVTTIGRGPGREAIPAYQVPGATVPANQVEDAVVGATLSRVHTLVTDNPDLLLTLAEGEPEDPTDRLRIKEIDRLLDQWLVESHTGVWTPRQITLATQPLREERAALVAKVQDAPRVRYAVRSLLRDPEALARVWDDVPFEDRRDLLALLIERVVIHPRSHKPRVTIVWAGEDVGR